MILVKILLLALTQLIRRPLRYIASQNLSFAMYIFWETSKIINSKKDIVCHQGKTKYYFSHWSTCVKRLTFPIFALHMELYVLWKLFSWCSELKLNFKCEGPRSNKWYFTRLCSTFHSFKQYCLSTNFQSHKKSETPNPVK